MDFNIFKNIRYYLYLLRHAHYIPGAYRRLLGDYLLRRYAVLEPLVFWNLTQFVIVFLGILFSLAFGVALGYTIYMFGDLPILYALAVGAFFFVIFVTYGFFVFLFFGLLAAYPFIELQRSIYARQIRKRRKMFPNLKVVAVAGSYGKTVMREVMSAVLGAKFHVSQTSDVGKTISGIAKFFENNVSSETEIAVVEVGTYSLRSMRRVCRALSPDVGILTGINEGHIDRFGSLENLTLAMFEVVQAIKPDGIAVVNIDNNIVFDNYKYHVGKRKCLPYGLVDSESIKYRISEQEFFEDGSGIGFSVRHNEKKLGEFKLPVLGGYVIAMALAAVMLGKELGMTDEEVRSGVLRIRPLPHHLFPVRIGNTLFIDDSTSGSPHSVREAIRVLARFGDRRKVYITPGLWEIGKRSEVIHYNIGEGLAKAADVVVLLKNRMTEHLGRGLVAGGFLEDKIFWYSSVRELKENLQFIVHAGDVVLFQNIIIDIQEIDFKE